MDKKWELIDRLCVYRGFFQVERLRLRHGLFAGGQSRVLERELVRHSHADGAVAVLPYDPVRDRVVLIEQFRTGAIESPSGPWLVEIVAGLVEPGEGPEQTALRETREECGCTPRDLHHLYDYYSSPGGLKERVSLYVAHVDAGAVRPLAGVGTEDEDIRVFTLSREAAFARAGLIGSAQPIIALQWLQMNHRQLQARWAGGG